MPTVFTPGLEATERPLQDACRIVFEPSVSVADQLGAAVAEPATTDVWLDFENVDTVNSVELSALIRYTLQLRRQEKTVVLCNVGPHLARIFEITRFGAWTIS